MVVIENIKRNENGIAIGTHKCYRDDMGNGLDRECNKHYDRDGNLFAQSYGIRNRRTGVYTPHREDGPADIRMLNPNVMELNYYRWGVNYNPDGYNCIRINKITGTVVNRLMKGITDNSMWLCNDAECIRESILYDIYRNGESDVYLNKTRRMYDKYIGFNRTRMESMDSWLEVNDYSEDPCQLMYDFKDYWSLDYDRGCIMAN